MWFHFQQIERSIHAAMNTTFHTTRACTAVATPVAIPDAVGRPPATCCRAAMTLSQKGVFVH